MSPLRLAIVLAMGCHGVQAQAQSSGPDIQFPQQTAWDQTVIPGSLQVGVGVVCDSSEQVKRYLSLKTEQASIENAVRLVNHEVNDIQACGMATVAFIAGDAAGNVDVSDGIMHVRQITVVAVATDGGWQRIPETVQYTAFFEKLEKA